MTQANEELRLHHDFCIRLLLRPMYRSATNLHWGVLIEILSPYHEIKIELAKTGVCSSNVIPLIGSKSQ